MRRIEKGDEPAILRDWKRSNAHGTYGDLSHVEREAIRLSCTAEQYFLCGYCCDAISGTSADTMNEHVEARDLASHRSLDFNNIIASCRSPFHCDGTHRAQPLPLTPLMLECESELRYKLSGRVEGLTARARETIRVLNLGDSEAANKGLIEKRKYLCDALLWEHGIDPADGLDDDDLIADVITSLLQPQDNRLAPFAPVLANMMRGWLDR